MFSATGFETKHPIVDVHPRSGERALLLGNFARQILDIGVTMSNSLLRDLQDHVTRPEHTVRWRWQPGDVAIWDNLATQHYAVADDGSAPRVMQRVTVAGDLPVAIDGRRSESLVGDSSAYTAAMSRRRRGRRWPEHSALRAGGGTPATTCVPKPASAPASW